MYGSPDQRCQVGGCQLGEAGRKFAAAEKLIEEARAIFARAVEERNKALSGALWCDAGQHAFSSKDRGRTRYQQTVIDEETGQEVVEEFHACGPCSRKMGRFHAGRALVQGPAQNAPED